MEFYMEATTKTTTHYWGYRELTADEVLAVSGGDFGDYADGGDRGYGDGAAYGDGGEYGNDDNSYASAVVDGVQYGLDPENPRDTLYAGKKPNGIVVDTICISIGWDFCNYIGITPYSPPGIQTNTATIGVRG